MKLKLILFWWKKQKVLERCQVIPWELQHKLVVVQVKKKNLFKSMKMKWNMQWRGWKLKEKETRKKYKDEVKELR